VDSLQRGGDRSVLPTEGAPFGGRPWERLDPQLAAVLEPELPTLADEIIAEIARAIPDYRRPMEGSFGRGLRVGVQQALGQFIGRVGGQRTSARDIYAELGRGELRAGRRLDALQAAYRVGARIAWRRVSAVARAAGADAEAVSLLAESIFAYIDEISAQSVEGYAQAQAAAAGERQQRRQRLVGLLIGGEPPTAEVLAAAAADAGWPLPRAVAVLVVRAPDAQRLVGRLGPEVIGGRAGELAVALVPDAEAPGRREQLAAALGSAPAAIGPLLPLAEGHVGYARARDALALAERGLLPAAGVILVQENLAALVLHGDPWLLHALAHRRLAPLEALAPGARERMRATLRAWLAHQGSVGTVARQLHLHPQTVRYRLARLRELFGNALDDPEGRFELELALRDAPRSERPYTSGEPDFEPKGEAGTAEEQSGKP